MLWDSFYGQSYFWWMDHLRQPNDPFIRWMWYPLWNFPYRTPQSWVWVGWKCFPYTHITHQSHPPHLDSYFDMSRTCLNRWFGSSYSSYEDVSRWLFNRCWNSMKKVHSIVPRYEYMESTPHGDHIIIDITNTISPNHSHTLLGGYKQRHRPKAHPRNRPHRDTTAKEDQWRALENVQRTCSATCNQFHRKSANSNTRECRTQRWNSFVSPACTQRVCWQGTVGVVVSSPTESSLSGWTV